MRPHAHGQGFGQSMVPMADMLTSTVGVVIFMLMFSVLAAGGATALKRLPIEQRTEADPVHFVCSGGKVYLIDSALADTFIERAGPPREAMRSIGAFQAWAERFRAQRTSDEDTEVTASAGLRPAPGGYRAQASLRFKLKRAGGETVAAFGRENSRLRTRLAALDARKSFAHFVVMPDGIDAFVAARELAIAQGLRTGWVPHTDLEGMTLGVMGSGGWDSRVQ